jgi:hypothetical protein
VNSPSNLAADLRTRGCAVCDHVVKTARDFFAQWQYSLSSDEASQLMFARDFGFCATHTWQLHSMSSPWGESIGLTPLAEEVARMLGEAKGRQSAASLVKEILRTRENCRACCMLRETEADYIQCLADLLVDPKARRIYERSQGVCLRHLAHLVAITTPEVADFLLAVASCRFKEVAGQMQNYAAKREATRRDLISPEEQDACVRALIHVAGARDYCGP